MIPRAAAAIATSLGVAISLPPAQLAAQEVAPIEIRSVLVLERPGRSRRSPIVTDAIEYARATGKWITPTEGLEVVLPSGQRRRWRPVEAGENGWMSDRALRGGYAVATVDAPHSGAWILHARGHRHVYVNGVPRAGDVYNLGFVKVPVQLRMGRNELLFRAGRGRLKATLQPVTKPLFLETRDSTLPDLVRGESAPVHAGLFVTNATEAAAAIVVTTETHGFDAPRVHTMRIAPLTARKCSAMIAPPPELDGVESVPVTVSLATADGTIVDSIEITLAVHDADQKHRRTFRSRLDGSVQYYGVTPMRRTESAGAVSDRPALFLSLHGAGVPGARQAHSYAPKDWGHVVAPTNRRPFGFDWEDWGRHDALEVLELAQQRFGTDPRRTYLTGHSMGGHGTWNLGAHFPDRFAAIGPSAGWRDFWSYAGGSQLEAASDPVASVLARSANGSRTLLLERNYLHGGVFVLHGDADDNVPVSQARFMRTRLAGFHPNWAYYERAGAGHWWGNQCMDWPPMFEFFARNTTPETTNLRQVTFRTVNPGISSRCHWITIAGQRVPLAVSKLEARLDADARSVTVATDNVSRLELDLRPFADAEILEAAPLKIEIDSQTFEDVAWPVDGIVRAAFDGGWSIAAPADPHHKNPRRSGTFKDAFRNEMVFVYGTRGSEDENRWARNKARYDAETFWYRGNGAVRVVADVAYDLDSDDLRNSNPILYGNADTNALWSALLADCPVQVTRDAVTVGERTIDGDDLACLFVYPRPGSDVASVGVVAGTGTIGRRATTQLPYFVSGVAYPDWTVIRASMLRDGVEGIRAAGFFASDWSVNAELSAWR